MDEQGLMAAATRREVLQAGAAGGALLALASAPATALADFTTGVLDHDAPCLHRAAYPPFVGRTFSADGVPLVLDAVDDIAHAAERDLAGSDIAFVLTFAGAAGALASGIHTLTLPDGTSADLFLSPVDAGGSYELLVDRSVRLASADVPTPEPAAVTAAAPVAPATVGAAKGARTPAARYGFLGVVTVRRARPGVRATLRFAKGSGIRRVQVWVIRGDQTYARGHATVRGSALRLSLSALRRLPRGRYELRVRGTTKAGVSTTVRRTVTIK